METMKQGGNVVYALGQGLNMNSTRLMLASRDTLQCL